MSGERNLANKIFINGEGELRCGWRVIVFITLFQIFSILLGGFLLVIVALVPSIAPQPMAVETFDTQSLIYTGITRAYLLVSALAASAICARLLERRSFASVGYKFHSGWPRDFGFGSIVGAITLAIAVAIAALAGSAHFQMQGHRVVSITAGFAALFIFFLIAAAFEEVLLRGFAFQALVHNLGPVAAVALTSVVFGLLHLQNPNVSALAAVNTVIAGVWLGVAYLATRSLWLATALHYSWNFAMAFIFGLPVSGITTSGQATLMNGQAASPDWLSGGSYGPEGGIAATLAIILSTLVIWKSNLFRPSEEMLEAIKHGTQRLPSEFKTPLGLGEKQPQIDSNDLRRSENERA